MRKLGFVAGAVFVLVLAGLAAGSPAQAAGSVINTIHVMNFGPSMVLTEMQSKACNASPTSQGIDGYVFPVSGIDATTRLTVTGTPAVPGTVVDLDAYFVDASCKVIGDPAWVGAYVTSAPVPAGTRYVIVDLTLGAEVKFRATWT